MDVSASYTDSTMYFSADERKWIRTILALKDAHPEEVCVLKAPEENDGCIYASLPSSWLKIVPPRKMLISEERRKQLSEHMKNVRLKNTEE